MARCTSDITDFLSGKRIVVAGVSRDPRQVANAILRRLADSGYEAVGVTPHAGEIADASCYPELAAVPGAIDGVVAVTHPAAALNLVRQCAERGVRRIWFHRAFGAGSVSQAAVKECEARGIRCIPGQCPMMYVGSVDPFHKCARWLGLPWGRIRA